MACHREPHNTAGEQVIVKRSHSSRGLLLLLLRQSHSGGGIEDEAIPASDAVKNVRHLLVNAGVPRGGPESDQVGQVPESDTGNQFGYEGQGV